MFQGTIPKGCGMETSAQSLLILMDMIIRSHDIKWPLEDDCRSHAVHVLVQLTKYNSIKYADPNVSFSNKEAFSRTILRCGCI